MSLNFFELGKSLFYILLQFHMYGVGDRRQLLADVGANPFDALPGLHRQRCDLQLERARLFLAAGRQMLLEGGVELQESRGQTIGGCEAEVALRLLEAGSERSLRITIRSPAIERTLRTNNATTAKTISDSIKPTSHAIRLHSNPR